MNLVNLKEKLCDYKTDEVNIFISYLKQLETEKDRNQKLKNIWYKYFTEEQAISLYNKVALDGLFIDGTTITIQFKGRVMISYNYQAYKNKLLKVYPETLFDLQNVYKEDTFSFKKESGKVIYTHNIKSPFEDDKVIIGCYCIIKNKRGEFIETLNLKEINKMRNVAKTKNIWDAWFDEMTLKSVIKRACKRHFNDVTTNIDTLDNENYDTELVNTPHDLQEDIDACGTVEELNDIYIENKSKVTDEPVFLNLLSVKRKEIEATS